MSNINRIDWDNMCTWKWRYHEQNMILPKITKDLRQCHTPIAILSSNEAFSIWRTSAPTSQFLIAWILNPKGFSSNVRPIDGGSSGAMTSESDFSSEIQKREKHMDS